MMQVGDVNIKVVKGDITEQEVEAIVNAANNHFIMGGGVAGAIKRKGGKIIEDEAVAQGPVEVGEAVITSGGKLPARFVIHASTMGMDFKTSAEKIKAATFNALKKAEEKGIKQLAFPALGCGVGRFSVRKAAEIMIEQIKSYINENPSTCIREVIFVLYTQKDYQEFLSAVKNNL
ncbi:macro domain-containing protein [Candidatus Aerophobetes bacterium]|nr:macro domain-containing protein [Candidatus Aerophobetes bacterium]